MNAVSDASKLHHPPNQFVNERSAALAARVTLTTGLRRNYCYLSIASDSTRPCFLLGIDSRTNHRDKFPFVGAKTASRVQHRYLTWAESCTLPQRLSQKMAPKQVTLGYVGPEQRTLRWMPFP